MSGPSRDLAAPDLWQASLARSHARRGSHPAGCAAPETSTVSDARALRDLGDPQPWELSLGRSRLRRRAAQLQFVPAGTRARRVSLGTLAALTAAPVTSLGDATAAQHGSGPATPEPPTTTEHYLLLSTGSHGRHVSALQRALGIGADGVYGAETEAAVRAFQASQGLAVDNVVGPLTSRALQRAGDAGASRGIGAGRAGSQGSSAAAGTNAAGSEAGSAPDPVLTLQRALGVSADGSYGPRTIAAVLALQQRAGLHVDGVVGPATWRALGLRAQGTVQPAVIQAPAGDSTGGPAPAVQTATDQQSTGTEAAPVRRVSALRAASGGGSTAASDGSTAGTDGPTAGSDTPTTTVRHSTVDSGGSSSVSSSADTGASGSSGSGAVARVIAAGNRIATLPYRYGGGHGSFNDTGYDCSGSVSYALHGAGLLKSPQDSTGLESYGQAGPGKHITIYANSGHAYMVVDGRRFDTSGQRVSGSRWSQIQRSNGGYTVRHPKGL